jgi:hypothetical protein
MQLAHRLIAAAALPFLSAAALASTTTYTNAGLFQSQVAAGAYTETFSGGTNPPVGAVNFSGGAFSYSAFAPSDIDMAGGFLGTSQIDEALTITFTSGNVNAFGANFFVTDINDDFQSVLIELTLSDGTVESFTPTSMADSYRGFTSDLAIMSLTISAPGQSLYAGLDNLTVGHTVPEPTSLLLAGLGLAGILAGRRRTR